MSIAISGSPPRPMLVFAHANSFPAGSYRKLFALLAPSFVVGAPSRLGHDPAHPVTDGWPHLRLELLSFVRRHAHERRVILVGHSLGGLLSLMLAQREPALVRCVILLDAPLVAGWRAAVLWAGKRSGLIHRLAPVTPALRRRRLWPDLAAVTNHFERKAPFAMWDPEMLVDYARAGTRQEAGQRALAFDRDIEARIYATLPHGLGRMLRDPPKVPIGFIGGTDSHELRLAGMAPTRRLVGANLRWIHGGTHLFPFEQPEATATAIRDLVHAMAPT